MFSVYWETKDENGVTDCGKAEPFESRANAERFAIAFPASINPAKKRLTRIRIEQCDDKESA